ncbi:MAG: MMPL family transporter [Phaeodactylibacter sp.]|nr:MMPL family transporter [Phaeodactylibacter sp.]
MKHAPAYAIALVEAVHRFRWGLLVLVLALLGMVLFFSPRLQIDNSITSWYTESDPALKSYTSFLQTYGNDDVILCGVEGPLPYSDAQRVRSSVELSNAIAQIPGVAFVNSYVQLPFRFVGDDYRSLESLVQAGQAVPSPEALHNWMTENPFRERLLGQSPNYVLFYVWPDTTDYVSRHRQDLLHALDSLVQAGGQSLHKGGIGVVYNGINEATLNEGWSFLLLSYFVLILSVLLVTGSYFMTALAFLTISGGTIALLGFLLLFDKSINIVTLALPPLIMVIGVSNYIHFTLHSRARLANQEKRSALILPVVAFVAIPISFNMLTTAGGFFSITTSSIQITRDYGLLAALCVLTVSLLSIFGAVVFHKKLLEQDLALKGQERLGNAVGHLMQWAMEHSRTVLLIAGLLVWVLTVGIWQIKVDTEPLSFIPAQHSIRSDHARLEAEVGPYVPLEFVLKVKAGTWKQVPHFKQLVAAQQLIRQDTAIHSTLSVADFVLYAYGRTPGGYLPPDGSLDDLSQRKLGLISSNLWQDPFVRRLTTRRGEELRIIATIPLTSADAFRKIHRRVTGTVEAALGDTLEIQANGYIPLYSNIVDTVLKDQLKSLSLALGIIFLLIYLSLRSWKLALLALPCNLLPIGLLLGAMGFLGLPLDIASVTLAATILGIIVDDSLHLLWSFKAALQASQPLGTATQAVARQTGTAVLHTSLILLLGYAIIALSSVPILAATGKLMVLAVVAALLADLLLLPAFLQIFFKKD